MEKLLWASLFIHSDLTASQAGLNEQSGGTKQAISSGLIYLRLPMDFFT